MIMSRQGSLGSHRVLLKSFCRIVEMDRFSKSLGAAKFISQTVFVKSFCKSRFQTKSVKLFSILVIVKDKMTNFWGSRLLPSDFMNTLCEIQAPTPQFKIRHLRRNHSGLETCVL